MQDRFKFRIWDKENFNYLEFEGFKKGEIEFNFDIDTNSIWIEFDHNKYILEQCTGLKDKNDKLIYEGDIVKIHNDVIAKIIFDKGCFAFTDGVYNQACYWNLHAMEVIGNIYTTPELLESN
jgi:uncharacterized phage protein (TIGR01671 family)